MTRFRPARSLLGLAAVSALLSGWPTAASAQLPADARFSYDLSVVDGGGGETPVSGTLFYTPGTPLTVRVYFRQTAGTTEVLARDGGLVGGGVRLTYGAAAGTAGVIRVAAPTDIVINICSAATQFNDASLSNDSRQALDDYAQFTASTDFGRGALPEADGRVFLGAVTFQTPGGGTRETVLTLDDIPPTVTDALTLAGFTQGYELDPVVEPVSFAVVPVTEPGAVLAAAVAGLAGLRAIRRVRHGRCRRVPRQAPVILPRTGRPQLDHDRHWVDQRGYPVLHRPPQPAVLVLR